MAPFNGHAAGPDWLEYASVAGCPERPFFTPASWFGLPIPVREWIVPDLIPCHAVTMLSGDGGLGKSTLALQLAVACAANDTWLGLKPRACRVLIVACEDDPEELHRRLHGIIQNTFFTFESLADIRIIPGVGFDNALLDFDDPHSFGKTTPFFELIDFHAHEFGANLVILDSLHDFFSGNENARPQARQFVNKLRQIAHNIDGGLLLLTHPSISGITSGSGNAGSTAWHNTVRSRLYLTASEDPTDHTLTLSTKKANYAKKSEDIKLEYRAGAFHNLSVAPKNADPAYMQVQVDEAFLQCLRSVTASGRHVTDSKQGKYAPKVFSKMKPLSRGFQKADFEVSMERLFGDGRLKMGTIIDIHRNKHQGLIEVETPYAQDENSA